MSIYESWGLTPIINASGAVTRLGGAPMPDAVLDAFRAASAECVPLDELQGVASRFISKVDGSGSRHRDCRGGQPADSGGRRHTHRVNLGRMEMLPHCSTSRTNHHRSRTTQWLRPCRSGRRCSPGGVGFNEIVAGAGVRCTEPGNTLRPLGRTRLASSYVYDAADSRRSPEVVALAHARGLPVLVDAAGELPPRSNLRRILETGADLVAFKRREGHSRSTSEPASFAGEKLLLPPRLFSSRHGRSFRALEPTLRLDRQEQVWPACRDIGIGRA